jgi:hypothetical protein
MNPSKKRASSFLGNERMEEILVEWANAATTVDKAGNEGTARFVKRYPELFPPGEKPFSTQQWLITEGVQTFLRLAWDAPDLRTREWAIFKARLTYHELESGIVRLEGLFRMQQETQEGTWEEHARLSEEIRAAKLLPPALTSFERVCYHFQRSAERARRCANPECAAPFFFAKRHTQKYCSPECSDPAQVEQKRLWWRENRSKKGGNK